MKNCITVDAKVLANVLRCSENLISIPLGKARDELLGDGSHSIIFPSNGVLTVDKDILVVAIVTALGGGEIDFQYNEVELKNDFCEKVYFDTQELIILALKVARKKLYKNRRIEL